MHSAAIPPAAVAAWLVNGVSIPGMNGTNPYFDAPLPPPAAGMSPDIVVYLLAANVPPYLNGSPLVSGPPLVPMMPATPMGPPMVMGAMPIAANVPVVMAGMANFPAAMAGGMPGVMNVPAGMPGVMNVPAGMPGVMNVPAGMPGQAMFNAQPTGILAAGVSATPMDGAGPLDAATVDIYERIEADWNSSNEIEKDLTRLRKQLVDILGRLKSLNRDLNGPERVHSNNQDKKDWQDARRCLRDATNRVWKYLKAHDIGDTSNAGKRVAFEEIYRKYIAPRRLFKEFMATARAFELHRKTITTLHGDMSNAYSYASLDGERKAQQVLNRIQQKVREASNKKNFLGVMLDS